MTVNSVFLLLPRCTPGMKHSLHHGRENKLHHIKNKKNKNKAKQRKVAPCSQPGSDNEGLGF